jgi:acetyl esterase/lipase
MTGITEQYPDLESDVYSEYSCKVKGIIDFYGPTDISQMNKVPSTMDHILPESPEGMLIGGFNVLENMQKVAPTICMNYMSEDVSIPPVLIFHGNKDRLVPFEQSILFYRQLKSKGKEVELYQLKGADHGGAGYWTEEVLNIIDEFSRKCFSKV